MKYRSTGYPETRLSRLRQNQVIRDMMSIDMPGPEKFIYPVFICEGNGIRKEIESMPGQYIFSIDKLLFEIESLMIQGIYSLMIFGVIDESRKTINGEYSYDVNGVVQTALKTLKTKFPELNLFSDVCLCSYTSHGHCGVMHYDEKIDNDTTLKILQKISISHIESGALGVAPSAMMDGQVKAIRTAFNEKGLINSMIISYSTKFASSMYGPFRDAANSSPKSGDRKSYQLDFRDWRQPLRESLEDEHEDADILMVKPSMFYLDIICRLRENSMLPIAAYSVSGEYSMLIASAQNGWGDLKLMVREFMYAQARAGVDIFISYWANRYDELLKK